MQRAIFRSILFNILFVGLTAVICVLLLPTLILPRRFYMGTVRLFVHMVHFLERVVLGLKYEVRGLEHLPKDGSYIVAAKHQSAYETMKLHILWRDPAVILKRELLRIPLWGMYLKKSDPIAIDRSTPDAAIESIQEGAKRMQAQNRPIIIFPQGTRVSVDTTVTERPYKVGVVRVQEATGLPIIPMAMNAGMYWPKNSFLKSRGTVVFEYLPAIEPGLERGVLLKKLEDVTEGATKSLMNEARESEMDAKPGLSGGLIGLLALLVILFGAYSFLWFGVADHIRGEYPRVLEGLVDPDTPIAEPEVYGFPGKIKMRVVKENLIADDLRIQIKDFRAQGWPIPNLPVNITTGAVTLRSFKFDDPLVIDTMDADIVYWGDTLSIKDSTVTQGEFIGNIVGDIDTAQEPVPKFDLDITLNNHLAMLQNLSKIGVIEDRMVLFIGAGMTSLADEDGLIRLPLQQREDTLYIGPLPIYKLPKPRAETAEDLRRENIPAPPDL